MTKTAHIIGAGLSGLSAAVRLANEGYRIHVHEATQNAGGRCRSYFDGATNMVIDNGNHLLLSANIHARLYALSIGSEDKLIGPDRAEFHFADVSTGKKWLLDLGRSRIPFWLFNAKKRVPDTGVLDYVKLMPLAWANNSALVGDTITCEGTLYRRLVQPLLLAALNVDPPKGSAGLAGAIVRETLLAGGKACRPLIAREGLSAVLVDPALEFLKGKGANIQFAHELRQIDTRNGNVAVLDFGDDTIALGAEDVVVLAVPARPASNIVLGLKAPTKFRAIVNAHFRYDPPEGLPALTGVVGGLIEWLFAFPNRLSITISDADRLINTPREELARDIWRDIAKVAGLGEAVAEGPLPPWQIVRERRATFEATPEQDALRPGAKTEFRNLFLAGDWTDTGLPSTIEGSVRSGHLAADLILTR
ncbi:MAG: FAD-binding protein [Bradyrhizobiaceae bacterium]|nr:MAG: FAD-binding protein [Bradyrhizobiaceae bacterium]